MNPHLYVIAGAGVPPFEGRTRTDPRRPEEPPGEDCITPNHPEMLQACQTDPSFGIHWMHSNRDYPRRSTTRNGSFLLARSCPSSEQH